MMSESQWATEEYKEYKKMSDSKDLLVLQEDLINRMNQCAYLIGRIQGALIGIELMTTEDSVLKETQKLSAHIQKFSTIMFYRDIEK